MSYEVLVLSASGLPTIIMSLMVWAGKRAISRMNEQELRLRTVEQAVVEIKFIHEDLHEIRLLMGAKKS